MSNKLKLLVDFNAYTSKNQTNDPSDDSTRVKVSLQESSFTELCRKQIQIADAIVDQSITLADADCDYLLVFCDQEITIKINGSSDAITIKPKAAGLKIMGLMLRGTVTALSISNASGSAVNMDILSVNL